MDDAILGGRYRIVSEAGSIPGRESYLATGRDGHEYRIDEVEPRDPRLLPVLEHELRMYSGVHHPNLARVVEWAHDGPRMAVVSERVPGADLRLEIGQEGRLSPSTAARYGADVAAALEQVHRRGLVHGNVRSDTIVRLPDDGSGTMRDVILTGFGLGLRDPAALRGEMPAEEAYYLAPEMVAGGRVGPQADVYSLGAVLYEMVTGRPPFDGPTAWSVADQHMHSAPEPVRASVPNVPASLERVIMRALEKSPEARFSSAAEMTEALDDVEGELAPVETVVPQSSSTRPWLWVAAAAALVIAALLALWALGLLRTRVTVPDVRGMSVAEATATIRTAGLAVGTIRYAGAPVTGIPNGAVARQTPAPGVRVASGTGVDLVLAGEAGAVVPSLVGRSRPQAEAAIRDAGLALGPVTLVSTSSVPAGAVITQDPAAGSTVAKGTVVTITVAQAAPVSGSVPNVTGSTQAQATAALESAGFRFTVSTRPSGDVAAGRVIDQSPPAGDQALIGSTVAIVVSSGPAPVAVPDVTTMTQSDATNALSDAGFRVRVQDQSGGGTVGTVVAQSPVGGTDAAPGTTVVITVAR